MRINNLFGLGIQSRSRAVAPGYGQNVYFENRPLGEKAEVVAYGTPGLDLFADAGDTPWRGLIAVGTTDNYFGVHRGVFYEGDNAGTLTSQGSLNSVTGRVDMVHNGDVVLLVDGEDGYTYKISTDTFAEINDADFLDDCKTCTWLDQYFVVENGTKFAISTDGTSWTSTEQAIPEYSPDGIVRVIADHGELVILGEVTTEFWVNTGATDFPFAPLKSSTAEWGCAAVNSVIKANDTLTFLAKNSDGQASVVRMRGYIPEVISNPDLEHEINSYSAISDATAFAYKLGGHPFYQLNFPTADKSWLFDALTGRWTPVKSSGIGRHRCEIGIQYLNRTLVSDYTSGRLYKLNPDTFSENGATIETEIVSGIVRAPDGERFPMDCLRVDMETGVGLESGQGEDPQVMLQVSRDGGNTWGAEMWRSAGKRGQYGRRVEWRRLGQADQAVFKLRMTDPVKRVFISASLNPQD